MQDYSNPASRNVKVAASGSNQGSGMLPSKVSVPLPGTNGSQPDYKGGMKKAPTGFNGGVIPGKI